MEKSPKTNKPIEQKSEADPKKINAAKAAFKWLKDNWKKSTILGVGAMMAAPSIAQNEADVNKQVGEEIASSEKNKNSYTIAGGHVLEKKQKKGEIKEDYQATVEDFIEKEKVEEKKNNPLPGILIEGSGESFRVEIPTKEGNRLFAGIKGEKEYKEWLSNFEKSGGKINTEKNKEENIQEKVEVVEQVKNNKEQAVVKNSEKDKDFYAEIPTSQGIRTFKGAKGKKDFEAFNARRNNNMRMK
ncbi:MAG TPA: hypothetical protein PLE26_00995 [Candidatus Paceibacterota bacterium]|nr:hypothetical protein [Candidatus Paceibacterota bacterium]HQB56919.1 hypothetical protein [Candidatus Paceibacterota bacterium]